MDRILYKQLYYRTKNYEDYESIRSDFLTDRYQPLIPIYVIQEKSGNDIKYIEPISGREIPIIQVDLKSSHQKLYEERSKEKINASSYGIMINESNHILTKINYETYQLYLNNPLKIIANSKSNNQNLKNYFKLHGQTELVAKIEHLDQYNPRQLFQEIIQKYLEIETSLSEDYRQEFRRLKAKRKVLKY